MGAIIRYAVVGPVVLIVALVLALAVSYPASGSSNYAPGLGEATDLVEDKVDEVKEGAEDLLDDPVDEVKETVDEVTSGLGDDDDDDGDDGDEGDSTEDEGEPAEADDEPDTRAASTTRQTSPAALLALRSGGNLSSLQGFRMHSPSTVETAATGPGLDDVLEPVTRDTSGDEVAQAGDSDVLTADRQSMAAVPVASGPSLGALLGGGALILILMATAWLAGLRPEDPTAAS